MTILKDLLLSSCADMGINLNPEAVNRFDVYARLLAEYNKKINLTSITEPEAVVTKHFVDSLCLIKYAGLNDGAKLADVGTGAGFPGCALLCAMPSLKVTLMDSVNKKLEFLRLLVNELGLKAEIITIRAEDAARDTNYRENFDIVTSRAVAALNVLSELCVPLVCIGGIFAPFKGILTPLEREKGVGAAQTLGCRLKSENFYQLSGSRKREIMIFKKFSQTPAKYPRSFSLISKKPL